MSNVPYRPVLLISSDHEDSVAVVRVIILRHKSVAVILTEYVRDLRGASPHN